MSKSLLYPEVKGRSHLLLVNKDASETVKKTVLDLFVGERRREVYQAIRKVFPSFFKKRPSAVQEDFIYSRYAQHITDSSHMQALVKAFADFAEAVGIKVDRGAGDQR